MNTEYKLSGKSGNIFIVGILLGPILVTLLSIIYAYIDVYNPIVYLTLLVFIGLLFGIISVQKLVIHLSQSHSILQPQLSLGQMPLAAHTRTLLEC